MIQIKQLLRLETKLIHFHKRIIVKTLFFHQKGFFYRQKDISLSNKHIRSGQLAAPGYHCNRYQLFVAVLFYLNLDSINRSKKSVLKGVACL